MNMSADPCDDFYEFACGNFDNVPPDVVQNKNHKNYFDVYDLVSRIKQLVMSSGSPHSFRPFKFLKDYMTSCENFYDNIYNPPPGVVEEKLDYLNELISKLGGWPAVEGDKWNETNFDWVDFTLKAADIGVEHAFFLRRSLTHRQNFTEFLVLDPPLEELLHGLEVMMIEIIFEDSPYLNFMFNVAEFLGANMTHAENELFDSMDFELEISKIASESFTNSLTDGNKTYGMTVKEMIDKWPSIDWMNLLNWPKLPRSYITNDSIIFIKNHEFVTGFEKLLRKTPKRVLANYAMWKTVQYLIPLVHSTTLHRLRNTYIGKPLDLNSTACIIHLELDLPELMLSYYAHHHPLDHKVKSQIDLMALDLKQKLIDTINRTNWLDDESRNKLTGDIESLRVITGYPEVLLDDKKMEEYFQGLEITPDDFLRNIHAAKAFRKNKTFTTASKPSDETNWIDLLQAEIDLTSVSAFNRMRSNFIGNTIFNAVLLLISSVSKYLFFNINRPTYSNYGALGFLFSHEMGHTVHNSKTFFDNYAFAHNRWSSFSFEKVKEKNNCLVEQLGNFTFRGTERKLNGQTLLAENIADQIGIEVAYSAYQDWVKVHGKEPTFPNLPYNPNQLFWLSYANQWCLSKSDLDKPYLMGSHPPYDKRVIVPLSNTPEFSTDFNCPLGSKMNPVKKCQMFE
ncbi:neprilysin-2-like [Microplitis mediator]|uniref:neprilysin-2-like n=1 Tax=Microplitis mediator TaxID=375433 RepID=UPI002554B07B|nr:neprilysin-2-like [Microplitis mediator]